VRFLLWVLADKRRIAAAAVAAYAISLSLFFTSGRPIREGADINAPPAAVIAGPFLIALALLVQLWARKDPQRRFIGNIAYAMTLIWCMSYGFVLFIAIHRAMGH
jgi:hypothetical protein